ncbi:MAG: sulfate adenylyltransferase [Phycisphaerae bacterium]
MSTNSLISPHGGELICRNASDSRKTELKSKAANMPKVKLQDREQCDLELLACGALSPLTGFMGETDFNSVCNDMKLKNGLPWTMPVTCSVDSATADKIAIGAEVALTDDRDNVLAVLTVKEKYKHDKKLEAEKVYRTTDEAHPGVAVVNGQGDVCLGGDVEVITPRVDPMFAEYRLTPQQTRDAFAKKGWKTVVAFQTRNPIHRAHEYITKCALEICDGLLVHPLVGETKGDDIPADVRLKCYTTLLDNYYSPNSAMMSVWPAAMRYAGPREAIFHALVRKNYGCTHFIVGRDHAGVGNYYGTYDAQQLFDEFDPAAIGITPLKFEHSFWCKKSGAMASDKTTNSGKEERVFLSGTAVREMLQKGQRPPVEFTRPEVADILIASMKS